MVLGGLWHGAGWTFVVWGGLHGFYLMINHAWRNLKQGMGWSDGGRWSNLGAGALTFLAVVVGWVFFRADSFSSAVTLLQGMVAMNGVSVHPSFAKYLTVFAQKLPVAISWDGFTPLSLVKVPIAMLQIIIGLCLAFFFPNACQMVQRFRPTLEDMKNPIPTNFELNEPSQSKLLRLMEWRPTKLQGACYGILFFILLAYMASAGKSEFLYFQF